MWSISRRLEISGQFNSYQRDVYGVGVVTFVRGGGGEMPGSLIRILGQRERGGQGQLASTLTGLLCKTS